MLYLGFSLEADWWGIFNNRLLFKNNMLLILWGNKAIMEGTKS